MRVAPHRWLVRPSAMASGLLVGATVLFGCGGSTKSTSGTTRVNTQEIRPAGRPQPREKVPDVTMQLSGPTNLEPLSSRYTCDGRGVSLPLRWSAGPSGTVEIDVFVLSSNPPDAVWAIAGLRPSVRELSAGKLPASAIVGRNLVGRVGYWLCPRRGVNERYIVRVLALPHRARVKPGFDSAALIRRAFHIASTSAILGFSYRRQ